MNVLVLSVAADSGGALTVMNDFYNEFSYNKDNNYYFVVGLADLKSSDNVHVLKFPWVKKSWIYRLVFDFIVVGLLMKKYNIDEVFSLQNTIYFFTKKPQTMYLHQSIPYVQYKFTLKDQPKMWVYQNLIGGLIHYSVKKSNRVIVQTKWMHDAVCTMDKKAENQVEIVTPNFNSDHCVKFDIEKYQNVFIYPASNYSYKNHIAIFKAVEILNKQGITNFKVELTLSETDILPECKPLYEQYKSQFVLLGTIEYKDLLERYSKSVLLFPSYVETFGLPLLEARNAMAPVIASNMPFSREVLDGYNNYLLFDPFNYEEFACCIKKHLKE